jgi:hypothetical protein
LITAEGAIAGGTAFRNAGGGLETAIVKAVKPLRRAKCVATVVVAAALVAASAAIAESRRIQVGTLTCSLSASIGLILGSQM